MVDREESRLKGMNLTKLADKDLFLSQDDDWESRSSLHGYLKGSSLIKNKPIGNYFEFEENSIDKDYISCHLIIPAVVAKVKTKVPKSPFSESEESEENEEDDDRFDLGVEETPTQEESVDRDINIVFTISVTGQIYISANYRVQQPLLLK